MKIVSALNLLGFKGKIQHYGYRMTDFGLADNKTVHFAQWLHPKCRNVIIDPEHVGMYRKIIQEGDFCIDIGAHTGDSTLPIALATGTTGHVLALEPNHFVYHVLEKNARANRHLCNIEPIMAAAFKQEGFSEFEYSDAGFCNGGRHENISVLKHGHAYKLNVYGINLQNELLAHYSDRLPKLKFIKVDAEGYDLYVLETLSEIINRYRPIIKSEIFKHTDIHYRSNMLKFFKERHYWVYKIVKEPVDYDLELTDDLLLSEKHYDIIAVPEK